MTPPPRWRLDGDRFRFTGWDGVECFTTTRAASLPAGEARPEAIRRLLRTYRMDDYPVVSMEQVHGAEVRVVVERQDALVVGCDGLATRATGVILAMRSADCLPLAVHDPETGSIGLAHLGWRGVKAGLPSRLVGAMRDRCGTNPADLHAAIGPGIGPCCYVVGAEFSSWFPGSLSDCWGLRLDLKGCVVHQLEGEGVLPSKVHVAPWCTACTPALCCSYRREGDGARRLVTVLGRIRADRQE